MATLNTRAIWQFDNQNFPHNTDLPPNISFPDEFPYEFDSPVESVVGSTESESDEDELLSGLTRQLTRSTLHNNISVNSNNVEKSRVLSGSPQSTLSAVGCWSGNGSPNGPSQAPSPPTTPYAGKEDSWELIHAAAGQVAMLKMKNDLLAKSRPSVVPPPNFTPAFLSPVTKRINTGVYLNPCSPHTVSQPHHIHQLLQKQNSVWGREAKEAWPSQQHVSYHNGGPKSTVDFSLESRNLGRTHSTWPSLQLERQNRQIPPPQHGEFPIRAVPVGGSDKVVRRESTGTGVFLPRRYDNTVESRKKSGSISLLQTKVEPSVNKNLDNITCNFKAQAGNYGGSIADYNLLLIRRNELLAQQRVQDEVLSNEIRLPQEWTY